MDVVGLLLLVLVAVGLSLLKTPSVKGLLGEKKFRLPLIFCSIEIGIVELIM